MGTQIWLTKCGVTCSWVVETHSGWGLSGCKGEVIWAKKRKPNRGGSVVANETWGGYNAVVGTHLGWGKLGLKD